MKVLQVTTHMNIGGIGNYILSLSGALKKKSVEVAVASSGGNLEKELAKHSIGHHRLDMNTKFEVAPKVIKSGFALARIIREEKADIIHAHTRVSQVASFIASRVTGRPYITTCHGFFKRRLRSIFDTWGAMVIAISDAVQVHLEEDLKVAEGRIELIYNGVDTDRFSCGYSPDEIAEIKKRLGLNAGPVIGTIGRLSSVKGQKYLLKAMKDILSVRRDVQAVIVGDGEEKESLKKLADSLGIGGAVHFLRSDIDTRKFLCVMDIFIFPSVKEGLGLALLEAMASSRACVASRIGGIENVVRDGFNGILVPVGDSHAIAEAALFLLDNENLRKSMGGLARDLVRERFSLDSMADRVIGLYQEILADRG